MEETTAKVSVIMPVYNAEKFLKDSIESVLNQTWKDFEFIIINDGSTDKSLTIIESYAAKDRRIKIIDQKNYGVSVSRNNGIFSSKGKYIAFIDADDTWINNKLEIQMEELLKDSELKICGARAKVINEENQEVGKFNYPPLSYFKIRIDSWYKNPFITSSLIIKKEILKDDKLFKKGMKLCEDYEFITKYIHTNKSINLNKYLVYYRVHTESSSRLTISTKIKMKIMAIKVRIISTLRLIKSIF